MKKASHTGPPERYFSGVERRLISFGDAYEPVWGYSRAVVVGPNVYVSGTARPEPPGDAYGQARGCLEIILAALAEAGAQPEDVVRTRVFLTSPDDADAVARAHVEVFGNIRPAATAVVVNALVDPRYLVEIEADAVIGEREKR